MLSPWSSHNRSESGINSLSSPPFLRGTSICCWLLLSSQLCADDQQLAWEHNPDFEQCNCHVGRYCPCVQRPKEGSQREHSQDCFRPFNNGAQQDPWLLPANTKSLFTTSDVPQGIHMPPRRISRGACMAELVLIRE